MEPINYHIQLEPNLENFNFKGKTVIQIKIKDLTNKIILNINDLKIDNCTVKKDIKEFNCEFKTDLKNQELIINLPEKLTGIIELKIKYSGNINDLMVGLYRSKYEVNGQIKYMAVTQFEEKDARRAFPCFDTPSKKATFDIEFIINENLQGISNTNITKEEKWGNGKKLVKFERTPKMSTYLIFFGIGEFEFIEDNSEKPLVRVATTPGKTKFGNYGLQIARKALKFGEDYTGIDFPISKCDYIAVADFAFGAMENFGAITFRENLLLVYPGITTKSGITRITSIIAHETAHLWFGDIVSPLEWKYLWLNESFATYFQHVIPDYYYPEWGMWDIFIMDEMLGGIERDSLNETMAVELPGHVKAGINSASAPIIYNKGASILRMLASYLGEEKFKKGIKYFLNEYKFSSASSQQFWEKLEKATGEPIKQFAESWIYQPGYPIIKVKREKNNLVLDQEAFTFIPNNSDRVWMIPANILLFIENEENKSFKTLINGKTTKIPIPENTQAFKINFGQTGFFRVKYEKELLDKLGILCKEKKLNATERFGLQNDLFALIRRGDYSLDYYLEYLEKYFEYEDEFLPIMNIVDNLSYCKLILPSKENRINNIGKKISENTIKKIGFEPKEGEPLQISMIRDTLLWSAYKFGSKNVEKFGSDKFDKILKGENIHPDILPSILKIGAQVNENARDYFMGKINNMQTPEMEKIFILTALGYLKDEQELLSVLEFNLDNVPSKNRYILINSAAHNPNFLNYIWKWFRDNLTKLEKLHPMHFERVIESIVTIFGVNYEKDIKKFFKDYIKKEGAPQDTIKMVMEILEVNLKLKKINN